MTEQEFINQKDIQNYIDNCLGNIETPDGQWIPVYSMKKTENIDIAFYGAFIPKSLSKKVLKDTMWDFGIGDGLPDCITYNNKTPVTRYYRFGNDEGIEPLIIKQNFSDVKKPIINISEEFKMFFNLYYDKRNGGYWKIWEDGTEELVISIKEKSDSEVDIKVYLDFIKKFITAKKMYYVSYFEIFRFIKLSCEEIGLKEDTITKKDDTTSYQVDVRKWNFPINDEFKTFSCLVGKKIIKGYNYRGCKKYLEPIEKYESFIVGIDKNGNEVLSTCNPKLLNKGTSKTRKSAYFLTPIFFKPAVLAKYYEKPDLYDVEDGRVSCKNLWYLPIDNNNKDYVVVFLGDLGEKLPFKEQSHWKNYNIKPSGKLSRVEYKRSILGQFTEPEREDLSFKSKYQAINGEWDKKYKWPLFLELHKDDLHYFKTLRIPLDDNQSEFEYQILSLTKLLVDSLNESKLGEGITLERDDKSISKLEKFFKANKVEGYENHIKFLRELYELRSSGVGHRKGKNYTKIATVFGIPDSDLRIVFEKILMKAIEFLDFIHMHLIIADGKDA